MAIYMRSEHVLRITDAEFKKIWQAYSAWLRATPSDDHYDLKTFLGVEDAEFVFGSIEVYITDPADQLKFKFDWSEQ